MQRLASPVLRILKGILVIGFSVRLVLGLGWMLMNFFSTQNFYGGDGFLYPYILQVAKGMGKVLPIPYGCLMYALQLGALAYAVSRFMKVCGFPWTNSFWKGWSVLVVLSDLILSQNALAFLPNAFLASALLLEISLCILMYRDEVAQGGKKRRLVAVTALWVLEVLLAKEYILFGALPAAVAFVSFFRQKKKGTGISLIAGILVTVLFSGGFAAGYAILDRTGIYSPDRNTILEKMLSRTAYNTVFYMPENIPEELDGVVRREELWAMAGNADSIHGQIMPAWIRTLGEQEAEALSVWTIRYAWENYRSVILHDMAWDFAGYVMPPVIMRLHLEGEGFRALTSRNYEIMRMHSPLYTKWYMDYSVFWFSAAGITAALCLCIRWVKRRDGRQWMPVILLCAGESILMAAYGVIQGAGMLDYKKTMPTMVFWMTWMLYEAVAPAVFAEGKEL